MSNAPCAGAGWYGTARPLRRHSDGFASLLILRVMPTDDDIAELYRRIAHEPRKREGPVEWGDGLVWAEMRHSTPWHMDWD